MTNEIKEINIPENVLAALGDLTNGALNYYKETETVKVRYNTILDYITNLQEENARLNEIIDELEKYLEDKNSFFKISTMGYSYGVVKDILDKLKELKEEGKIQH